MNLVPSRRRMHGVTLIELVITLTVVGLLAAIAYPSYIDQVRKSHRSDAKSNLLALSQKMERLMSEQGSYASAVLGTDAGDIYPAKSDGGYYALSITATATTFTATATPLGDQVNDTCGTYTYDDKGTKGSSGDTPANCW